MKIFFSLLVLISSLLGANLDWPSDYKQALKEAKQQNKDVYILITSSNCRWCRKFESTTLQNEDLIKTLKKDYVLLHIDRDKDYLPSKFKSKRVPRHYFIQSNSKIIYTLLGYWNKADFLYYLDDVKNKKIKGKKQ